MQTKKQLKRGTRLDAYLALIVRTRFSVGDRLVDRQQPHDGTVAYSLTAVERYLYLNGFGPLPG
jgi:hypothetical protein